jgi:hypothetical protein
MKRVVLFLCSLLFAVSVKAEISDHDNRGLGQAKCRCEAPGENLYNRRLDQETAVFDDDDDDNDNHNHRQLPFLSSSPYFVINGVQVLPSSNAACSSHRDMEESNEEDKELEAELEQMDENESIVRPDKLRNLKVKSSKGKGSRSGKSVSCVQNEHLFMVYKFVKLYSFSRFLYSSEGQRREQRKG